MSLYELTIGWRYLKKESSGRLPRIWLLMFAVLAIVGGVLFQSNVMQLRVLAVVLMLLSTFCAASVVLLRLFSTFAAISMLGITLGIAILIWVLSVTSGFHEAFRQKVLGVNAHILVLKTGVDFSEYRDVMAKCKKLPEVTGAAPFVFNEMMIARGNRLSGVLVKGVLPELVGHVLDLPQYIQSMPRAVAADRFMRDVLMRSSDDAGQPTGHMAGIVIGQELARKLGAKVGDPVRLISPLSGLDISGWSNQGELPRSRDFVVSAIFNSGFDEYDKRLIYVHLREAQAFFNQGDVVTGVELKIRDVDNARVLAKQLRVHLKDGYYRTVDWAELNRNLFTALAMQKLVLEVVIGFIVIVAAFSVLSALTMLVIRKTREIAILKAMGTDGRGIRRIFVAAGMIVWFLGTSLGLLWGYFGALLLDAYGFPLDAKVYLISQLPVKIRPIEFIATAIFSLGICLLATLYPAARAAKLDPITGLRYR